VAERVPVALAHQVPLEAISHPCRQAGRQAGRQEDSSLITCEIMHTKIKTHVKWNLNVIDISEGRRTRRANNTTQHKIGYERDTFLTW
jgi:hypothetical protein